MVIISEQAFCEFSASCIQNWKGFIAACWKASVLGQLALAVKPGKDFSLTSIVDGEAAIGFGDLICSSQASIMRSIVLICKLAMDCNCVRVASTICSGHPIAAAASAIFSMTCLPFFSL